MKDDFVIGPRDILAHIDTGKRRPGKLGKQGLVAILYCGSHRVVECATFRVTMPTVISGHPGAGCVPCIINRQKEARLQSA